MRPTELSSKHSTRKSFISTSHRLSRAVAEALEPRQLLANPGDIWQRSVDWTPQTNPDAGVASGGSWQYESVPLGAGGLGQNNPWYAAVSPTINGTDTKNVWDANWGGGATQGWVYADDVGPLEHQNAALHVLSSNHVPVVRWMNTSGHNVTVALSGNLTLTFNEGSGGTLDQPVEFIMMLQKSDGTTTPLMLEMRRATDADLNIYSGIPVINVPTGASIFYSFRYKTTTTRSGWITLNDQNMKFTLKANVARPITAADAAVTTKGLKVNVDVLANDNWDARTLPTVSITTQPTHGTATVRADGSIDYVPDASGIDDYLIYQLGASPFARSRLDIDVATPKYLHVKPTGDDNNTGNDLNNALASLNGAKLKARLYPNQAVEVIFEDGVYYNTNAQTIQFDVNDSRQAQYPVIYRARNARAATISGGIGATNLPWVNLGGGKYRLDNVENYLTPTQINNLHSLFVNGQRATRAREPDIGFYTIVSVDSGTRSNTFTFGDTDISGYDELGDSTVGDGAPDILSTWTDLQKVEIIHYTQWNVSRRVIDTVIGNTVKIQGTINSQFRDYMGDYEVETTRYYVENVLEGLDEPGEWYLNKPTKQLYYKVRAGEIIGQSTFVVPVVNELIHMTDTANVRFDGLVFSDTDWETGAEGGSVNPTPGAVFLDGTSNITFANGRFTNNGFFGIQMPVDPNTTGTTVVDTEFVHNGGGAVQVSVHPDIDNARNSAAGYHRIALNSIYDNNEVWEETDAIFLARSGYNSISANEIWNTPACAIDVGWFDDDLDAAGHNRILWNNVHDNSQMVYDAAGIYLIGSQPGTIVMGNTIHNVKYTGNHLHRFTPLKDKNWGYDEGGPISGIYTDQSSAYMRIMGNTISDVNYGFFTNPSRGMIQDSNIIIDAQLAPFYLRYVDNEPDEFKYLGQNWWTSNLITWTNPTEFPVYLIAGSEWVENNPFTFDKNIYEYNGVAVNANGSLSRIQQTLLGGGYHDINSLVTTQLLFVNAGAMDYRIRTSAQALLLGQDFEADWLFQ